MKPDELGPIARDCSFDVATNDARLDYQSDSGRAEQYDRSQQSPISNHVLHPLPPVRIRHTYEAIKARYWA